MTLAEQATTPESGEVDTSSMSSNLGSSPRPKRKRKPTGTRRKEEIEQLEQQVKTLQAQVEQLQKSAAKKNSAKLSELEQDVLETGFIRQAVLQQQASLVNVQSALSRLTMTQPGAPHATSIRLGTDLKKRWATLAKMKPIKLRAAQYYLKERGLYVSDTSAFSYSTRFVRQDGCYCGQVYDVVPFEGISSVKLVYNALLHFFSNMEIRVTESLGDITI